MTGPAIAVVAGEMSGDLLGARLMRAIRAAEPEARFSGIGGPEMEALGFDSFLPMERLSVMGLFEAAGASSNSSRSGAGSRDASRPPLRTCSWGSTRRTSTFPWNDGSVCPGSPPSTT